ncbi:MAG TPA: hypothetical protein VI603_10875, partial [Saprospiraceae bacterium]|nr:hypothetical protein [Saprospiraceae bacterium]
MPRTGLTSTSFDKLRTSAQCKLLFLSWCPGQDSLRHPSTSSGQALSVNFSSCLGAQDRTHFDILRQAQDKRSV